MMTTSTAEVGRERHRFVRGIGVAVLFFCCAFCAQAQQRGAINGRVVNEEGAPLPGMTIYISTLGSNRAVGQAPTALTDEEGNFRFNNLPPRSYVISVADARGYVQPPSAASDALGRHPYRIGESATITLIKGGVITGRVYTASGDPMIGTYVSAIRVRDADSNKVRFLPGSRQRMTDDRGIYRLYGLQPGRYIIAANNGVNFSSGSSSPYEGETPTYYPSATRDTAAEVTVTSGTEVTGIDIRHRGERGHVISGKVISGVAQTTPLIYATQISLTNAATGTQVSSAIARQTEPDNGFAMLGIPDGEYLIEANFSNGSSDQSLRSEPRRISVKGSDVTGLELRLAPLATIAGQVLIEQSPSACDVKLKRTMEEILLHPLRAEKSSPNSTILPRPSFSAFSADEKGGFQMNALPAGHYRLESDLPNESWFVKSISKAGSSPAAAPSKQAAAATHPAPSNAAGSNEIGRNGIALKSGEKVSGVTINLADGAAELRGKVSTVKEGTKLPSPLKVHLVPADPTAADDVLRYAESPVGTDGGFTFGHLAPGRYWLLARAAPDDDQADRSALPVAWDPVERIKLRKDAEAAKNEIELKACQRVKDHVLRF